MKTSGKTYLEGTLTHIPLRRIVESEDIHYRKLDKEHVTGLLKTIEANGLDQPLVVWNGGGSKGVQVELENGSKVPASFLVAGRHRQHALRLLFKRDPSRYKELFPDGIPVIVRGGELQEVLAAQLRENVQKKDATAEEVFPVIRRMRDEFEMSQRQIAKSIGKSEAWVSQIFDIEETLGEEAAEELESGSLKLSHARKASKKVKQARKAGKSVSASEELQKLKKKSAANKAKGRKREERRMSASKVFERYCSLPRSIKTGQKLLIAEAALGYLAGEEEYDLPKELVPPQAEEKKSKKSKK